MSRGLPTFVTLGLSAGVAAAIYFAAENRLEARRVAAEAETTRLSRELAQERATQIALAADNRRLSEREREESLRAQAEAAAGAAAASAGISDASAVLALRKEALLSLAALRKQQVVFVTMVGGPGAFVPTRDGALPAAFGQAFGLAASEFAALQNSVAEAKSRLDALALKGVVVSRPQPNVLAIEITDREEFAVERERLREAFRRVLGPERFSAYEILQPGGAERIFQELGGPRSITVSRATGPGQPNKISIRHGVVGGPPGTFSNETSFGSENFADVVRQLGAFAALFPADF